MLILKFHLLLTHHQIYKYINDASFSTTMTNLIATKSSLSGNNNFSGTTSIFSYLPYYINTSDQLINKNYVDGRFTNLISSDITYTGSNYFSSETGTRINRLFSTDLTVNNGYTRRSVNNIVEFGMGQTSPYIYYENTGKFGCVNTTDSTLNWNISLNSVFTIKTINSTTENVGSLNVSTDSTFTTLPNYINSNDKLINKAYVDTKFTTLLSSNNTFTGSNIFNGTSNLINNLYSNILSINNGTALRSNNDLFNVSINSLGNYFYYNNSSTFGHINTSNSASSWSINSSGLGSFPTLISTTLNSTTGTITNLYSNILAVNNNNVQRAINDIFEVATSSTGNYLYYNNSSVFGHINTSNSALSWFINSSGSASFPSITTTTANITTDNVGILNVSGTASTVTNLAIGSSIMRMI